MGGVEILDHIGDRIVAGLDAEAPGGRRDALGLVTQRLEQPQHAVGAGRDPDQHRTDEAVALLLGEIVEDLVPGRRNVLEQLLHQLVVVVGQRLEHVEAGILLAAQVVAFERDHLGRHVLLVDEGALERQIDEAGDDLVLPDRNLAQHQRHPRCRLQELERLAHPLVGLVDLVEEEQARHLEVFQLAQHQFELRHLALVSLAHHHRGVDRRQHRAHLVDEFDRARAIHEGVVVAHEVRGRDRDLDAHLVMAGFLAGVADRGSGIDRALALDRVGPRQHRLEQRGLAALEWTHQRNAPWTSWTCSVVCH